MDRILIIRLMASTALVACAALSGAAQAQSPQSPTVAAGSVAVTRQGGTTVVTQSSQRGVVDWRSFSVGPQEAVRFDQPGRSAVTLNRVTGAEASRIDGAVTATGQVWLANPNGVMIGPGGQINVGGLLATTGRIDAAEFLKSGRAQIDLIGNDATIANAGTIKIAEGGYAALAAASIRNEGSIAARAGAVALGAGKAVTVDFAGDKLITFQVTQPLDQRPADADALIVAGGAIAAEGGTVLLTARAAKGVIDGVVNLKGHIVSTSVKVDGGTVTFGDGGAVVADGRIEARTTGGDGGRVTISGAEVRVPGVIDASGDSGGTITVQAQQLRHDGAMIADGRTGSGGRITVQASESYQATVASRLQADSDNGDGGVVRVLGTETGGEDGRATARLFASGAQTARSASGRGGAVDLIGHDILLMAAAVDVSGGAAAGTIRVGGDWQGSGVLAHAATVLVNGSANFTANGGRGKVVVWSDQKTMFGGVIAARGGAAEVSSKGMLTYGGAVDAASLLLDPKNIVIDASAAARGAVGAVALTDPGSGGAAYGTVIKVLPNGNIVVTSPDDNGGRGAAYLWNGATGGLISALSGSAAGDRVSSDGVVVLSNGNYVIRSGSWAEGGVANVGAVTFGRAASGVSGSVSVLNSLKGFYSGDRVGSGAVTALINGNYVVAAPDWSGGRGAVAWANGTNGSTGAIDQNNALVGSLTTDRIGSGGVTALTNGAFVIASPNWQGAYAKMGAVTWGDGASVVKGLASARNSLTGNGPNDQIGSGGVTALANGNYVVNSPEFSGFGNTGIGAVKLMSGTLATGGGISNYLYGGYANAHVGSGGVVALIGNGNYVVRTNNWDNGSGGNGAVTWQSGSVFLTAPVAVSATNSFTTTNLNANVGGGGVVALTNGNYVVSTPGYDIGPVGVTSKYDAGAVTWGSGATGISGVISASNSLIGEQGGDAVGSGGVLALKNGAFVALSPNWAKGTTNNAGAATWGSGTAALTGSISASNSLIGDSAGDNVGSKAVALSDGNYVTWSSNWNGGQGAATFGAGASASKGVVSNLNSVTGGRAGDEVAGGGVVALQGGAYVVVSPKWGVTMSPDFGAVTYAGPAGATGLAGNLATTVKGSGANDQIGSGGVMALGNGDYAISSPNFSNGKGALTILSGSPAGIGSISMANSLIGAVGDSLALVGASVDGKFVIARASGGKVLQSGPAALAPLAPISFSESGANDVTVSAAQLAATLAAGTAITLQASNDISVNAAINVTGVAGGALTLQAGRSILVNASIATANGNLALIANDQAASGVVNAQRDAGAAQIVQALGATLDTGSGALNVQVKDGAGLTNNASGDIVLRNGSVGSLSANNAGPSGGAIRLLGVLAASGSANSLASLGGVSLETGARLTYAGSAPGALLISAGRDITLASAAIASTGGALTTTLLSASAATTQAAVKGGIAIDTSTIATAGGAITMAAGANGDLAATLSSGRQGVHIAFSTVDAGSGSLSATGAAQQDPGIQVWQSNLTANGGVTLSGTGGVSGTAEPTGVHIHLSTFKVGGVGDVKITGTAGSAAAAGRGVLFSASTLAFGGGSVRLEGTGPANATIGVASGVAIEAKSSLVGSGSITVIGRSATKTSATAGAAVAVTGVSTLSTTGSITLDGDAGGAGSRMYGVLVNGASIVRSTGATGSLSIQGASAGLVGFSMDGAALSTMGGDIVVKAAGRQATGGASLSTASGTIRILPTAGESAIILNGAAGDLDLSDGFMGALAGAVEIGQADWSGDLVVQSGARFYNSTRLVTGGRVNFAGASNAATGKSAALTVNAGLGVSLNAAIGASTPLASFTANGPVYFLGDGRTPTLAAQYYGVKTIGAQSYGGAVSVASAADASFTTTGANVTFSGALDGPGAAIFDVGGALVSVAGAIGATTALAWLTTAANLSLGAGVSTVGAQRYSGSVALNAVDTLLTTTNGVIAIDKGGAFTYGRAEAGSLTMRAALDVTMSGASIATTNGALSVTLNAGADAVDQAGVLGAISLVNSSVVSRAGSISLVGGRNGAFGASGMKGFLHGVTLSGSSLSATGAGAITVKGVKGSDAGSKGVYGADSTVTTAAGDVTLIANALAWSNPTTASATISAAAGTIRLQPLNAADSIGMGGGVGDLYVSGDLVNSYLKGIVEIGRADLTGSITVNNNQPSARAGVDFTTSQNITFRTGSGAIKVTGSLDGAAAGAQTVVLVTGGGAISFAGSIGANTALNTLKASGGPIQFSGDLVNTVSTQSYGGAVALASAATVSFVTNNAPITFASTLDGPASLSVATGTGAYKALGTVGGLTPLASITINGVTTLGANVHTTGAQTYNGAYFLGATDTVLATDSGDISILAGGKLTYDRAAPGSLRLLAARDIILDGGQIVSTGGALNVTLNAGALATKQADVSGGVLLNKASIITKGGSLQIVGGKNGALAASGSSALTDLGLSVRNGVLLINGAQVDLGVGSFTARGVATSTVSYGQGVEITGSTVTAKGGISLTGTGSDASTAQSFGVLMLANSVINAGDGGLMIDGTGGARSAVDARGVVIVDAALSYGAGALAIAGRAGTFSSVAGSQGVALLGSSMRISGSGSATLSGTGGGKAGTTNNDHGVFIEGAQIAVAGSGALSITGARGAGNESRNIRIGTGGLVASEAGALTLSGTASTGGGGLYNQGVEVLSAAVVRTATGAISLEGAGGATGDGVALAGLIEATGAGGSIQLRGVKGGGWSDIVWTAGVVSTTSGDIVIQGNQLNAAGSQAIRSSSGAIKLRPLSAGDSIGVNGASGAMSVTKELLNSVSGRLEIGSADQTATITIADGTALKNPTTFRAKDADIAFIGAVDSATAGAASLSTVTIGATSFGGSVGGGGALSSLAVFGPVVFGGGGVKTSGAQSYGGPVTLTGATALAAGGAVSVEGALDGAHALSVTGSTVSLTAAVGGASPLASLTVAATAGAISLSADVTTSGAQNFNAPLLLSRDLTLNASAGDVAFKSSLDAVGAPKSLSIRTGGAGSIGFGGAVGSDIGLRSASLSTNGGRIALASMKATNLSMATSGGAITQSGPATVAGNLFVDAGSGRVALADAANRFTEVALTAAEARVAAAAGFALSDSKISGGLTLSAGGAVTQTGPLQAGSLSLQGAGASFALTDPANAIAELSAKVAKLSIVNGPAASLSVSAVGLAVTNGLALVQTGDARSITLSGPVELGASSATMTSSGVIQGAGTVSGTGGALALSVGASGGSMLVAPGLTVSVLAGELLVNGVLRSAPNATRPVTPRPDTTATIVVPTAPSAPSRPSVASIPPLASTPIIASAPSEAPTTASIASSPSAPALPEKPSAPVVAETRPVQPFLGSPAVSESAAQIRSIVAATLAAVSPPPIIAPPVGPSDAAAGQATPASLSASDVVALVSATATGALIPPTPPSVAATGAPLASTATIKMDAADTGGANGQVIAGAAVASERSSGSRTLVPGLLKEEGGQSRAGATAPPPLAQQPSQMNEEPLLD